MLIRMKHGPKMNKNKRLITLFRKIIIRKINKTWLAVVILEMIYIHIG